MSLEDLEGEVTAIVQSQPTPVLDFRDPPPGQMIPPIGQKDAANSL
jgi:hypothetical protein